MSSNKTAAEANKVKTSTSKASSPKTGGETAGKGSAKSKAAKPAVAKTSAKLKSAKPAAKPGAEAKAKPVSETRSKSVAKPSATKAKAKATVGFSVKFQPVEVSRIRDGSLRITTIYNLDTPPRARRIEAASVADAFDLVSKAAKRHGRPCYAVIAPDGDVSKAFTKSFEAAYETLERFHNLPAA
jgi:hypothetical protein